MHYVFFESLKVILTSLYFKITGKLTALRVRLSPPKRLIDYEGKIYVTFTQLTV